MKRISALTTPLYCTALATAALLAVCVTPGASHGQQRGVLTPRVEMSRVKLPTDKNLSGLMEVQARCMTGDGRYEWLLRAQLFDAKGNEVWNSQQSLAPETLTAVKKGPGSVRVSDSSVGNHKFAPVETKYNWQFQRQSQASGHFRFILQAVAVPLAPGQKFPAGSMNLTAGGHGSSAREATLDEITAAREQRDATYVRKDFMFLK